MKFCVVLLILASFASAENVYDFFKEYTAYGYHSKVGIPEAERIRIAEEKSSNRIAGGVPAAAGQYPFKAGLLGEVQGLSGVSVCGGALISTSRIATAAHCWNDGQHQVWRFTIVLGSVRLFSGGTRVTSSAIATHPNWSPFLYRNDVAVIFLVSAVATSSNIAPIALPSGSELFDSYVGQQAIAIGFGATRDGEQITSAQSLNHVSLSVIANSVCTAAYPLIIQLSNICTSGVGAVGSCSGDSGGPLVVIRNNRPVLVGLSQFRSAAGCQAGFPSVFARVTSFMDFFNSHL